jgi:hypothetical protein
MKAEIIRRKLSYSDRVLVLLLEGKELSQRNINDYIPEMPPHHLSSVICELRNNRLVPILDAWSTDGRFKCYWMSDDAILDYFDSDARNEQMQRETFNVQWRRLARNTAASKSLADAVSASEEISNEFYFLKRAIPELAEKFAKAYIKISPSSSSMAQAQDCANGINASDNGGNDG